MSLLDRLERKLGRYAVPHLTTLLVGGQVASFVLSRVHPGFAAKLALLPSRVIEDNEWWRVVSFLFVHPTDSLIFIIFALYLLYLMGSALESYWGAFRFNVFLLIGWIGSVAAAFAVPGGYATNVYLMGSIFLAFAWLNPDFQLLLFFILPVKVKWLAWLTWAGYLYQFITGPLQTRLLIVASVANFFLFFGREMWLTVRAGGRRAHGRVKAAKKRNEPFHRCLKCGLTDLDDPDMQFRYCPECKGQAGYCMNHIHDHEHVE